MKSNTTREITLTAEEVQQAIAESLNAWGFSGVVQDSTTYQFNVRGASLDTAYDGGQIFDGCTVTIVESDDDN